MSRIIDWDEHAQSNITDENIRKARKKARMTQTQLSAKLETMAIYICRGSISRIENGSRLITDIELKAIADILRVPIEQLFEE